MMQAADPVLLLQANPTRSLSGTAAVPGDKSMSHRALVLAAMAGGSSVIHGLLESDDICCTANAVQALGATVLKGADNHWVISGGSWRTPDKVLDCGNSGTSARLLMGAIAGRPVIATLTGDGSLSARPMGRVVEPLLAMGAGIDRCHFLPISVRGGALHGISFSSLIPSAQVKSAILLAGLHTHEGVEVFEPVPTRDHTERMLRHFGCELHCSNSRNGRLVRLGARRELHPADVVIPGDPSSAAFAIVAALVTSNSEVRLSNILDSPTRGGLMKALIEMGADIHITERRTRAAADVADIVVKSSRLRGVRISAKKIPSMIDEIPLLAVAAASAEGETLVQGLAELRHKESDRLSAIETGLRSCGVDVEVRGDSMRINGRGRPPGGALIQTQGDHRIAMAFLVLGLASVEPVAVDQPEMIATSFPGFEHFMAGLGADIHSC